MPNTGRVTITLPAEVVRDIDRVETNRSRFVLEAVRHELKRRHRDALQRSLRNPHPEMREFAEVGFDEWAAGMPQEDVSEIVHVNSGTPVRWVPGEGWVETTK